MPALSVTTLQNRLLARGRFRHMQALVALAELGSVGRAAQSLGMTQSGTTKLLSELESLMETQLFERHARGVRPTPACTGLLALANQAIRGIESAAAAIASSRRRSEGVVRIMGTAAAVNGLLAEGLVQFSREHPTIQVQLNEAEYDDILLALSRGQADMAACREPANVPAGWRFTPVMADEMVIVCAASHPLARKRTLAVSDLADEVWMPGPPGALSWNVLDAITADMKSPAKVCEVLTRVSTVIWWIVHETRNLGVVPLSLVSLYVRLGKLRVLQLAERFPLGDLGLLLPDHELPPPLERLSRSLVLSASRRGGGTARRTTRSDA